MKIVSPELDSGGAYSTTEAHYAVVYNRQHVDYFAGRRNTLLSKRLAMNT